MARLIDADAFDRRLAAAEFDAALNNADDENRPFREQAMYYSTQSFRDVMRHQPTVDAIPVEWVFEQMQILHELHNKNEYVLQWLMELWQKEQEAQDRKRDYEAAVEMAEYCERYESTYNADDGSM